MISPPNSSSSWVLLEEMKSAINFAFCVLSTWALTWTNKAVNFIVMLVDNVAFSTGMKKFISSLASVLLSTFVSLDCIEDKNFNNLGNEYGLSWLPSPAPLRPIP